LGGAGYSSVASTTDSSEVCDLHRKNRYDLILLDLQMPGMNGFQVMERLKEIEPDSYLPVLVITAQPGHRLRALQAGARDFISKPFELSEVLARVQNMVEVRLLHRSLQTHNDLLEQRVRERTADVTESYLELIFTMTRAAEHKDENTGAHVQRISYYCRGLAGMLGLDEEFIDRIFFASPMHDIGKIGIPDDILLKRGALSPDEWKIMRGHTLMGAKILGDSKSPYLQMGAEIALNHHEHWDGSGYPAGKRGLAIPLASRVMNVCDVYDALRSKRPYKDAFDHSKTVDIMTRGDGRLRPEQFDPAILEAFQQSLPSFREIFDTYDP
ncbi:MAG TPA: HD domain-containing phosphohydrolase, partial [Gemmatimonadota bacterium]|nr:HD domain-containing phosphohydrolase [Gemmatimonadota bacterium]